MIRLCNRIFYNDELYHHGVKGQKWGVRRYQDTNGRRTSLGKQHQKDAKINKKIDEYIRSGKAKVTDLEHYTVGSLTEFTTPAGQKYVSGLINAHDFDWQEVNNYSNGRGWHNPADIIKTENGEAHRNTSAFENEQHSEYKITQSDLSYCNPNFGASGTTQNCAKCSANLELRLRGFDVSAGRQTYPSSADAQSLWFKDAKRVDYDYDSAEDALRSYGSKTSGTLSIHYPNGAGGHAMHWTNDSSGNFQIQDGQNGRTFSSLNEMANCYGADKSASISTYRLDNCEPNWDAMSQDSVIRLPQSNGSDKVLNRNSGRIVDTW